MVIDKINTPEHVEIRYRDGSVDVISQPERGKFMYYELEHFIELVESGIAESKVNSWATSLDAMRVMDEARKQIGLTYPADRTSG